MQSGKFGKLYRMWVIIYALRYVDKIEISQRRKKSSDAIPENRLQEVIVCRKVHVSARNAFFGGKFEQFAEVFRFLRTWALLSFSSFEDRIKKSSRFRNLNRFISTPIRSRFCFLFPKRAVHHHTQTHHDHPRTSTAGIETLLSLTCVDTAENEPSKVCQELDS